MRVEFSKNRAVKIGSQALPRPGWVDVRDVRLPVGGGARTRRIATRLDAAQRDRGCRGESPLSSEARRLPADYSSGSTTG
jgi:hypothetical protein